MAANRLKQQPMSDKNGPVESRVRSEPESNCPTQRTRFACYPLGSFAEERTIVHRDSRLAEAQKKHPRQLWVPGGLRTPPLVRERLDGSDLGIHASIGSLPFCDHSTFQGHPCPIPATAGSQKQNQK
jgi:hypothetical protein